MVGISERPIPPTARERAAFDAATTGTPKEFVRTCQAAGLEPRRVLDSIEAAPWRWLFSFSPSETFTDEIRHRLFQPAVKDQLDAARDYLETSWWRRMFGPRGASEQRTRHPSVRREPPDR